jgi:hypothetical protein
MYELENIKINKRDIMPQTFEILNSAASQFHSRPFIQICSFCSCCWPEQLINNHSAGRVVPSSPLRPHEMTDDLRLGGGGGEGLKSVNLGLMTSTVQYMSWLPSELFNLHLECEWLNSSNIQPTSTVYLSA